MAAPTLKIAVIQLYPEPLQIEQNYAKAESFIRTAATRGAHLAVLPEYHLTSWLPSDPGFLPLCAQSETYLKKYQALAKELSICIVPGTLVELHRGDSDSKSPGSRDDSKDDSQEESNEDSVRVREDTKQDKLLNVAYFISASGSIAGKYIKKNLWGPEREHLTSSSRDRNAHQVFDTSLGKVGMLICWDLAFPEAFRELVAQGAKLIIVPTFWKLDDCNREGLAWNPSAEALFLDSVVTARAFENTAAIIFCNAGGPPGHGYAGLSQITVPFVGPLTRLGSCAEGMSVVDVDMKILDIAEDNYKIRADLARDDWHYDYRHSKAEEKQ